MPDLLGDFSYVWPFYAAGVGGYLLGSIPFGLLITRLAGTGDLRRQGSGNIGAINVLRTGRKDLAALTLLLDGGKGAVAVLVAGQLGPDMALFAAAGVIIGHVFPIWLRLKGGKGVATAFGVLLALDWLVGLVAGALWLAVAALTRYASLASLFAMLSVPGLSKMLGAPTIGNFSIALALIILFKHIDNIRRLRRREEPRIGDVIPHRDRGHAEDG